LKKLQEALFWSGKAIDMESRLRVGHAIGKTEEEIAPELMRTSKNACAKRGTSSYVK